MRTIPTRSIVREILIAISGALAGFIFSLFPFFTEHNATEESRLNDNLNKILDVNLQYPFLEKDAYINWWDHHKDSNNDSSLRYQTYVNTCSISCKVSRGILAMTVPKSLALSISIT